MKKILFSILCFLFSFACTNKKKSDLMEDVQIMGVREMRKVNLILEKMPPVLPAEERKNWLVEDLTRFSYIAIDGVKYFVSDVQKHEEDDDVIVYELRLLNLQDGKTYYMETEVDELDEVNVYLTTHKVKFRELGISPEELEEIAEKEEGFITYDGVKYFYEDDYEASATGSSSDDDIYLYEFVEDCDDFGRFMTIEEWDEGEYDVWLGHEIDPAGIEILVLCQDE